MGGSEKSGTPSETRRATALTADEIARLISDMPNTGGLDRLYSGFPGAEEDILGRLTSAAQQNILGFNAFATPGRDPGVLKLPFGMEIPIPGREATPGVGLEEAIRAGLADPRDVTAGLFSAMQPFEAEETARQVGGQREAFGALGGRFSRNLLSAEGDLRGRLAAEFGRNREQALLQAAALRNQAAQGLQSTLLGGADIASRTGLGVETLRAQRGGQILNFLRPGGPVYDPGILPGLLTAGATLGGAYLAGRN